MTTMAKNDIATGADNCPPMLDKVLYGPLNYGTIKVDGVTRTKTYKELSNKEKLQDDCDIRATNIWSWKIIMQKWAPDEWYYEGEMLHLKYLKAEDEKEAYKQCLIDLAKDRKKLFVSIPPLPSFYSEEDDFEVLD
ncbi:hypothetical protein Tco_0521010 [Tanacetum coccineum]